MLCQRCGEREATIHEVTIRNGKSREHYLCEGCAQDVGMQGSSPPSMEQLLPGLIDASAFAAEADAGVDAELQDKLSTAVIEMLEMMVAAEAGFAYDAMLQVILQISSTILFKWVYSVTVEHWAGFFVALCGFLLILSSISLLLAARFSRATQTNANGERTPLLS